MVTAVLLLSELIILFSIDISKLTHLHSKLINVTFASLASALILRLVS